MSSIQGMTLPDQVELCEVGPRDGFQFEDTFIPTDRKVAAIEALAEAGLPRIQVTSFVHPKWVPQMADAEDVAARIPDRDDVVYSGLVLNEKGLERALATRLEQVDLSIATNQQHSRDNVSMSVQEAERQAERMVRQAHEADVQVQLGLQTVFGYDEPGDTPLEQVLDMARRFGALPIESLSLADTTGLANPVLVQRYVAAVQEAIGDVPLVLHLHDTRGLGLANVLAALQCGVTRLDTSMAGMGGCPFIPGAAGNIATEDTAYMLQSMGVETGVSVEEVARVSRKTASFLDKSYPGKLYRLQTRNV